MIEARDVSYRFREGGEVLRSVTLSFAPGRLTAILGPNGAGKTTLLKLLSGSYKPSDGGVMLEGRPISSISERRRAQKIAVVSQRSHVDFAFTVTDVVLMGRQPYLSRYATESEHDISIAREAMALTETEHLADRTVTQLSGGEWQRVVIARALCQQTPVMLLDEPVSSLDIKYQLEVLSLVRKLTRDKQVTAVCVLHDINLAAHFADDIALMHDGAVFKYGAPREVLTREAIGRVYGVEVDVEERGETVRVSPVYELASDLAIISSNDSALAADVSIGYNSTLTHTAEKRGLRM